MYRKDDKKTTKPILTFGWLLFCLMLVLLALLDRSGPSECLINRDPAGLPESEKRETEARTLPDKNISESPLADEPTLIPVYLVGAVHHPGIYQIKPGTYLYELIEMAGGLTEDAAADHINLAAAITMNQLIRLPTQEEEASGYNFQLRESTGGQGLVDLNRADLTELASLPGIGPATAQAILAFREENGSFACIEDIMLVPGIKEARFNALKDLVMVSCS